MNEMSDVTTIYLGLFICLFYNLFNEGASKPVSYSSELHNDQRIVNRKRCGRDRWRLYTRGKIVEFDWRYRRLSQTKRFTYQDPNPGPTEYKQLLCNQM